MMTWGFWILFAVGLCALAECCMWFEKRLLHRRRRRQNWKMSWPPAARPPATAREKQAARKLRMPR